MLNVGLDIQRYDAQLVAPKAVMEKPCVVNQNRIFIFVTLQLWRATLVTLQSLRATPANAMTSESLCI